MKLSLETSSHFKILETFYQYPLLSDTSYHRIYFISRDQWLPNEGSLCDLVELEYKGLRVVQEISLQK